MRIQFTTPIFPFISLYLLTTPNSLTHTEYGSLRPKRREGGGDLATRLHLSKASRADPHNTGEGHPHAAQSSNGEWNRIDDNVRSCS